MTHYLDNRTKAISIIDHPHIRHKCWITINKDPNSKKLINFSFMIFGVLFSYLG
jgi:hypothetical protein